MVNYIFYSPTFVGEDYDIFLCSTKKVCQLVSRKKHVRFGIKKLLSLLEYKLVLIQYFFKKCCDRQKKIYNFRILSDLNYASVSKANVLTEITSYSIINRFSLGFY